MKNKKLYNLYFSYTFNRLLAVFFIVFILVIAFYLSYLINNNYDEYNYLENPILFHENYMNQGLLIIYILNSIFIFLISYILNINSLSFDILFISYNNRGKIVLNKLLVSVTIFIILILIEYELLLGIGVFKYQYFLASSYYHIIFGLFLMSLIEYLISSILVSLFSHITVGIFSMIFFILVRIISYNNNIVTDKLKNILPLVLVNEKNKIGIFVGVILVILLTFIYLGVYLIKEVKNNA